MRGMLAAVLVVAAASASADSAKVAATPDVTLYVDTASIGRTGDHRQAAVVHEYAKEQGGGIRSRRVVYEIDCTGERLRSRVVSDHAEPMGRGASLATRERESDWMYVGPRTGSSLPTATTYRAVVSFVCAR